MSYIYTYYLTISAYFYERILHSVCNIIGNNFRLGQVQASGGREVMCQLLSIKFIVCANFA